MNFIVGILIIILFPFASFCQNKNPSIKITPITENYFVFTTWNNFNGVAFPSNGMYVVTNNGVVMIDTPWDTSQVLPLLDSIESRHHQKVVMCIATHFHDDRTGGFDILKNAGVPTWSSALTRYYCNQKDEKIAENVFLNDTTFLIGGISFETYYPGPAHTSDNIVVWFPGQRVLYGGCLVKSVESESLGNVSDADIFSWSKSIKNIQKKYPKPGFFITGHQNWNSLNSLKHTLKLLSSVDHK